MDLINATNATVTAVAKMLDFVKNNVAGHMSDGSLTAITKLTRSEPLTVVSKDCANLDYLPDVLNTLASIYSGYFLQAVAILTKVNDIEVVRILDRLNPDRDSSGFLLQGRMATESIESQLSGNYQYSLPTRRIMALEQDVPSIDRENQKTIYETANLAVGKLLNVRIVVNGKDNEPVVRDIPVSVRLAPAILDEETISYIFTHRKMDTGFVERYHSWRSGRIQLVRDLVFCQDLINEYRRAAMKDTTGTLNEIVRRVNNARSFGLLTNNPSLAVASNIYVLSKDSARFIEQKCGQKFSSTQGRNKILEDTYAMIVAVIDPEWEQVTFYFRDIAQASTMKIKSMKSSGSNKGPDIGDVMKTLLEGRAPSF